MAMTPTYPPDVLAGVTTAAGARTSLGIHYLATVDVTGQVVIDNADAYTGVGTATSGAPRWKLGTNTPSTDDSAILICRDVAGDALFSHAFRDESTFESGPTDSAYCSYDSIPTMTGALAYNHFRSFQARPRFNGSVSVSEMNGFSWNPVLLSGNVAVLYGMHISDATGAGTAAMHMGIRIETLSKATANFGVYVVSNVSYFGGQVQCGADGIFSNGPIFGSNLATDNTPNLVALGMGVPAIDYPTAVPGYYSTWVGHNSGHSIVHNNAANFCSFFGAASGYSQTTGADNTYIGAYSGYSGNGSGNIFLGKRAGYYETGSSKFYVDNDRRADEATARTLAILYGVMGAAVSDQTLTVNALLKGTSGRIVKTTSVNASTYNVLVTDDVVDVIYTATGACAVQLMTAQMVAGRKVTVVDGGGNANTNPITISTEGAELINGDATYVINAAYGKVTVTANAAGTKWLVTA